MVDSTMIVSVERVDTLKVTTQWTPDPRDPVIARVIRGIAELARGEGTLIDVDRLEIDNDE